MNTEKDKTPSACFSRTKKSFSYFLSVCSVSLLFFASSSAIFSQSQDTIVIVIGTVSGQLENESSFSPFTEYLESRLPDYKFEVQGFNSIQALMSAVNTNTLDFAFITPAAFVELRIDNDFRVLATITQPAGDTYSPWLAGAVFTRDSNRDINSLSDAANRNIVALSEIALGGWLSAVREWQDLGININSDMESVNFVFSYSSVIETVCSGAADIGVIAANTFNTFAGMCDEPLRILPAPLGIQENSYPLPHSTRLYPEVALAMTGPFEESFVRNMTRALLDIEMDGEVARSVNISGFTAPLSYRDVQSMMQELRLGPYSDLGELTLRQFLRDNNYSITLVLMILIILISAGFINSLTLSRKFRNSEHYRKSIFEGSHIPMVIIDKDLMAFLDMNLAAVKQYGFQSKDELIGKSLMLVSDMDQDIDINIGEAFDKTTKKVIRDGKVTFDWRHIRPSGEKWLAKIHLMAFESIDGKLIQATIEDITLERKRETERLQLEQQLEFSQRMESIGRLAGGIAHDFNNLLTVINGYCEILIEDNSKNAPMAKILEQIRNAGGRAAELTQKLLTFSRRQVTRHIPVNTDLFIEDSAEMFRSVLGEHIRFELDLDRMASQVLADPGQLQQVLLNLVVNAKDAMPDGGILKISTRSCLISNQSASKFEIQAGKYIEILVSDTGIGMDKNISQHIFEPFFSTKDTGTGLGLSTVYGIIQQSKGTILVDSKKGEGTTFRILLPETDEQELVEENKPVDTLSSLSCYTILVVEDQLEIGEYTSSVLRKAGHTVLLAQSGDAALELMENQKESVHLLITDVVMDGMNGGELAEIFSQQYPGIPVLFISGYPADDLARHGIQQGTNEFLGKPFSPIELLVRIKQLMEQNSVLHD